jgi:hypothetical protein
VQVYTAEDGAVEIRYRDRVMPYQELAATQVAANRATAAAAVELAPSAPTAASPARPRRRGQGADHPWHHGIAQYHDYRQLTKDRRAWARAQP